MPICVFSRCFGVWLLSENRVFSSRSRRVIKAKIINFYVHNSLQNLHTAFGYGVHHYHDDDRLNGGANELFRLRPNLFMQTGSDDLNEHKCRLRHPGLEPFDDRTNERMNRNQIRNSQKLFCSKNEREDQQRKRERVFDIHRVFGEFRFDWMIKLLCELGDHNLLADHT